MEVKGSRVEGLGFEAEGLGFSGLRAEGGRWGLQFWLNGPHNISKPNGLSPVADEDQSPRGLRVRN